MLVSVANGAKDFKTIYFTLEIKVKLYLTRYCTLVMLQQYHVCPTSHVQIWHVVQLLYTDHPDIEYE